MKQLKKVFKPELWVGHVNEMEKLWKNMPEKYRYQVKDYAALKAKAVSLSTASKVMSKEEHIEYVEGICEQIVGGEYASALSRVVALNTNRIILLERLKKEGQKLTKEDFLSINSKGNSSIIFNDTLDNIREIAELLRANNEFFTAEDFFKKCSYRGGNFILIYEIGDYANISKIFQPQVWIGHVDEMEKQWQNMPEKYKDQVKDYAALKKEAQKLTSSSKGIAKVDDLCKAIRKNDYTNIDKILAAKEVNVNAVASNGLWKPLICAVDMKDKSTVEKLLVAGADPAPSVIYHLYI